MRTLKNNNFLRTLSRACAGLLLTTTFVAAAATADARTATFQLDIPAQSLGDALQALALASQHKLLYDTVLVKGKSSLALKGEFTTEQAVREMLTGTGLSYEVSDGLVLIRSTSAQQTVTSQNDEAGADGRPSHEMRRVGNDGLLMAQAEATKAGEQSAAQKPSAEPKDSEDSAAKIQEIVVTAQKRAENLQDVPISISVLSGKELDSSNFEGVTDALRGVPGVAATVAIQGSGTQLTVRGVSGVNPLFQGSTPIGYYLDGVPVGLSKTAIVPDANVYDLERVEVLRGPQGTLYGAGGMGGVVRVLTHDADLDAFDFKARTSVSSTAHSDTPSYRGDFAANVPLVPDVLAARAAVSYQDTGGWIDRPNDPDANGSEALNARLKLRAEPTDRLTLRATAWISRDDYVASYSGDNRTINSRAEPSETNFDIYAFNVEYDFGGFALTNTTSQFNYDNSSLIDLTLISPVFLAGLYQDTIFEADVFTDELSLSSTGDGDWRWTLGGIYRDSDDWIDILRLTSALAPDGTPPSTRSQESSRSWAVFGELTRSFMDGRAELTVGGRYFEDHDVSTSLSRRNSTPLGQTADTTFHAFTPRVTLTLHPSKETTLYASYSEGFRSGQAVDAATAAAVGHVQPDTLTNYEAGIKSRWLDGRLDLDAAVYYIDWRDSPQSILIGPVPYTGYIINSETLAGPGFEIALTYRPVDGLTLGATYAYNDLTFQGPVQTGGTLLFDKGERNNFSLKTTAGVSIDYDFPLGSGGFAGRLSASANYSSALPVRRTVNGNPATIFEMTGEDITLVRMGFQVTSPGAHWTTRLFVDNLFNEDGLYQRNWLGVADWDIYTRPRTIGLQLEYRLGR